MITSRIAHLIFVSACLGYASEHHGSVTSGGLPVPGATITATREEKIFVTTTDERGEYSFPNLVDGIWTMHVEMFGFGPQTVDVLVIPGMPSPHWEVRLLSFALLKQQVSAQPPPTQMTPSIVMGSKGPNSSSEQVSQLTGAHPQPSAEQGSPESGLFNGFQRLAIEIAGNMDALDRQTPETKVDDVAFGDDSNANALPALTITGSVSRGLSAPPQRNDWSSLDVPFELGGQPFEAILGLAGPAAAGLAPSLVAPGVVETLPAPGPKIALGSLPGSRDVDGRSPNVRGRNPNAFGNNRKSRHSQYNGNVALVLENSALDAKPFSLTGQNTPKAAYDKFRSTGSLGGPLKIPHLVTQKTSFSVNYQLSRSKSGGVATGLMPNELERQGNFSQLSILLPLPFVNNILPASLINPQAQILLSLYPLPNFSGNNRYNYQVPITRVGSQSNVNARITETIDSNNQIGGNFAFQESTTKTPNLFDFLDARSFDGWNTGMLWSHHFTSHLIGNLRDQFSRSNIQATPYFSGSRNISGQAGIRGNDQSPEYWGPPTLTFSSGISMLSDGNYSRNHNNSNAMSETMLWVRGKHNVTFGGDFRRLDFNQLNQQDPRGILTFTGAYTGNGVAAAGNDFADFLLGVPDTIGIAYGNADKYFRESWVDSFVTDDWRITSRLSLNIGGRWDFQAPVTELRNRLVNLDIGPNFTSVTPICAEAVSGCVPASEVGYPESLVRPNYHEIQPRIGVAWRPVAKSTTVVRAGYGIYYNTSVYEPLASQMAQQAPLSYSFTQPNSLTSPYTLANAFLIPPTLITTQTFALDPNFRIGYLHYWQLSIQHNLSSSLVATLTYNGDIGLHQVQMFLPNSEPPGATPSPYPSGYIYETSNGKAHYNALSERLQRRFRSGVSFNAVYTFSKAMDDAQTIGGRGAAAAPLAQNWQDLAAEWSLSTFNRTHSLNLTAQFSPGQGLGGGALLHSWRGALAKNWTFQTTMQVASGLPETPTIASLIDTGTGMSNAVRADLTGAPMYAAPAGLFLNPAAFISPTDGQWGNAGRDIITGPMLFSLNESVGRVFQLPERHIIDLRFDITNVLNHVTYASWNTTVGSALFGVPTAARPMRSMRATLRFMF